MAPVISLHIGPRTDDFNKMFPTDGGQETVDSPKQKRSLGGRKRQIRTTFEIEDHRGRQSTLRNRNLESEKEASRYL
jgi:hypothetical protein